MKARIFTPAAYRFSENVNPKPEASIAVMKRKSRILVALQHIARCAALLALLAATPSLSAGEDGERVHFSNQWQVDAEYPQLGDAAIDKRIADWLEECINTSIADVAVVSVDPGSEGEQWTMAVTYEKTQPSRRVVGLVFDIYTGSNKAAHPMSVVRVLNFDLDTGKELRLDEMFLNPEAALEIMAHNAPRTVADNLKDMFPEQFASGVEEETWFREGFEPTRENYAALVIEPDGVRVYFQKYQILPYVFGIQEAHFPLSLLEPAGPNHALWGKEVARRGATRTR